MSEMTTKAGWRARCDTEAVRLFPPNSKGYHIVIPEEDFREMMTWQVDQRGACVMPKTLTAENGAKGLLSGEFSESVSMDCGQCYGDGEIDGEPCEDCTGAGSYNLHVTVGWPTIKEIYAKAVEKLRIK